jgi:hypothetical protein
MASPRGLLSLACAALATACAGTTPPAGAGGAQPGAVTFSGQVPPWAPGARFVVCGDTQRTSLLEFWREQNDAERARVIGAIAAEHPAFLALTGDLVFDGSSARQWADFDALTAPLRAAGVPVFPAFGNHEYWGGREGERHLLARFPHLQGQHHYTLAFGPLRLVVLDSNLGALGERERLAQARWYAGTLDELDRDPAVRGVLVLWHHPPYTNSTVTGDEARVQRELVPAFLAARKTLALLSGHVHSYERFARSGKAFITSGGGGGPRARLLGGAERRHPDDLYAGPALRDFNFVILTVEPGGVSAEVRGLPKGGETWTTLDRFSLPFPAE